MRCNEARKFLAAFVDDQLDVRTNVEVLEHVEMCQGCGARLERLERLGDAVASYITSVRAGKGLRRRLSLALSADRPVSGRLHGSLQRLAHSRWFTVAVAAASILLVFGLVLRFLVAPPAPYNTKTIMAHTHALQDKISTMYSTTDAQRARRLALFTMDPMPEVPLLDRDEFKLISAGPEEIELKNVGHFVFFYRATSVSMFVFEGLALDEIKGNYLLSALGPAKAETRGDYNLLAWRQGYFTYVLVSSLPTSQLVEMVGYGRSQQ